MSKKDKTSLNSSALEGITRAKLGREGRVHRLNLHDTYDIAWDVTRIAREFLQNFYDSVPTEEFGEEISIDVDRRKRSVILSGPDEFDVEYLLRIGVSTKSNQPDQYAGQFGEGFAMASLVAMRDHGLEVEARTGSWIATFYFDSVTVGKGRARELCCRVTEGKTRGSQVKLSECREPILAAFEDGRKSFRYEGNALFGERLGQQPKQGLFIYRSTTSQGAVFYRRQKRAEYDLPYIICHDRELTSVRTDRERKNLQAKEVREVVEKTVRCLDGSAIERLVMKDLRGLWVRGHPLLTALGKRWHDLFGWGEKKLEFPDEFVAKGEWRYDREVESLGLTLCASSLVDFGMITGRQWKQEKARGKLQLPTAIEGKRFRILREVYELIFGSPLEDKLYKVFVPENEDESYEGAYGDRTIAVKQSVLAGDFPHAVAVFVHEALHPHGYDGGREFSDKLTEALEHVCKQRKTLDSYERRWAEALQIINSEDTSSGSAPDEVLHDGGTEDSLSPLRLSERIAVLERDIANINLRLKDLD